MQNDPLEKLEKINKELREKLREFDADLNSARVISRDVIYKIIFLCSTIIGFSVTLITIKTPLFEIGVDTKKLQFSWYLFLLTIIVGFASLLFEGRLHYALAWRALQVQIHEDHKYSLIENIKIYFIVLYSIIFPRNLFFCRIYKTEEEKNWNALANGKTVRILAELEKFPFLLENLFIAFFVIALFVFVTSYSL